jgi:hypothetical protein
MTSIVMPTNCIVPIKKYTTILSKPVINCNNCKHCVIKNEDTFCSIFEFQNKKFCVETSIIRFPEFDFCGIEAKYFSPKDE